MQKTRCKFFCSVVKDNGDETKSITLDAVYNGSEENKEFFKYTPSGQLQFGCANAAATEMFVEGKEYYIDIIQAVPDAPAEAAAE